MLQLKIKGHVSLFKPTVEADESVKKKGKKNKVEKEARKATRSAAKKKKKVAVKGIVKPRTAEQKAKSMAKAGTRNKPLKAAKAQERDKKETADFGVYKTTKKAARSVNRHMSRIKAQQEKK